MKLHKVFVSEYDEQAWLCKLGSKGYLLTDKSLGCYTFEKTDSRISYRIDFLNESPKTDDSAKYLEDKAVCGFKGNSAYIRDCKHDVDSLGRQKKRYGKLTLFFAVLTLAFTALMVYNKSYVDFFNSIEYVVPADSNEILPIFNFVVGKNPAELFSWVIILFFAASVIPTVIFLREWALWAFAARKQKAAIASQETDVQ